jgi:Family of unknown function (DUF6455)
MQLKDGLGGADQTQHVIRQARGSADRQVRGMGSSKELWPLMEQVRRRQRLMDRMMLTTGVNMSRVVNLDGGLTFLEARSKCRLCPDESACVHWMEDAEALEAAPEFCPNAKFLKSCGGK